MKHLDLKKIHKLTPYQKVAIGTWKEAKDPAIYAEEDLDYTPVQEFSEKIFKNWTWKERYPKQNVILKYLKYFSNELKLKKNIVFNEKVISAKYKEKNNLWKIQTNNNKKSH